MSAVVRETRFRGISYLQLELLPHSVLFVGLDNDVEIVKIFDDEVVLLVHRQKYLLDRRIT